MIEPSQIDYDQYQNIWIELTRMYEVLPNKGANNNLFYVCIFTGLCNGLKSQQKKINSTKGTGTFIDNLWKKNVNQRKWKKK